MLYPLFEYTFKVCSKRYLHSFDKSYIKTLIFKGFWFFKFKRTIKFTHLN